MPLWKNFYLLIVLWLSPLVSGNFPFLHVLPVSSPIVESQMGMPWETLARVASLVRLILLLDWYICYSSWGYFCSTPFSFPVDCTNLISTEHCWCWNRFRESNTANNWRTIVEFPHLSTMPTVLSQEQLYLPFSQRDEFILRILSIGADGGNFQDLQEWFWVFVCSVLGDRVLCTSGWPLTLLCNWRPPWISSPSASSSWVLGLEVCTVACLYYARDEPRASCLLGMKARILPLALHSQHPEGFCLTSLPPSKGQGWENQ